MKKASFAFHAVPAHWGRNLPDGDYTVGRGADPRSAAERAADPDGSIARRTFEADEAARSGAAKIAQTEQKPSAQRATRTGGESSKKLTRSKAATAAAHVLSDARASKDAKSAAGSALAQKAKKFAARPVTSSSRRGKSEAWLLTCERGIS